VSTRADLQPISVEDGIDRFLRHRESSVGESTMANARTRLRHFAEWADEAGIENLNDLTGRDLSDFVEWRRDDIAPVTLQKQLSTVRMALRYWADIEGVTDGLAEKLHAPELPDGAEAREIHLTTERAETILEYLDRYEYASRRHVVMALLWRTGMRRSALRSIDLDDLQPDEHAITLEHRPETGTILKNGEDSERWVYLGPRWYQIVEDYVAKNRIDIADDHGRDPLITTKYGRPTGDTIYRWVNIACHPCEYGRDCPHDRDPQTCEAKGTNGYPARCPDARSPHAVRRGSITHHLNAGTAPEVASERMNVSLDVLYQHYDARDEREKMNVRKESLPDQ
jgi:site-specific recombinase XerD